MEPEAPWANIRGAVGSREVVNSAAAEKEERAMGLEALDGLGTVRSSRLEVGGGDMVLA